MLATTLNMHCDILEQITKASKELGKSRRYIIILLLKRIMRDHQGLMRGFTTIKYQPDDDRENWHCFHIRFKQDEYEFFSDLRKFCKYSVSFLVAMAVDKHLDQILADKIDNVDNYANFNNYVLHQEIIGGIISTYLFWGYPEEHLKTIIPLEDAFQT